MISRIQNDQNPMGLAKQMADNIVQKNPQAMSFINNMRNQCGSGNPREYILNYCRQNGIPESVPIGLANAMGLK